MIVFTSGRDYRPLAALENRLPSNAVYARVLVAAEDLDQATECLTAMNLDRYAETLRFPTGLDGPAEAINAYVHDHGVQGPAVFVVYRMDRDGIGEKFHAPLILAARVLDSGLEVVGRIRQVSIDGPNEPYMVCRVLPDDGQPDPLPVAGKPIEGPPDHVPMVEGLTVYPSGALGYMTKRKEAQLTVALDGIGADLVMATERIEQHRRSSDPKSSWVRESDLLMSLSRALAEAAADAVTVETVLKSMS